MRLTALAAFVLAVPFMTSAQSSSKQTFGANPNLPFSGAVKAGGLIYVSGAIGPASGAIAKGDIRAQTRQTIDNLSATLTAAGSSLSNVVSVMVYLRNSGDFQAMNEVYSTYWPKDPPTRTTVVVTQPLAQAEGLIEISMIAVPTGSERVVVHPSDWMKSPNPYSYGIKSGNTLFLAGLVSRNGRDNSLVRGDIEAQTRTVLDNGAAILKAAGMSLADVVSSRVYLTDERTFQAMNATYRSYFPAMPPARATVKAGLASPDYVVEITMVAVKDPSRRAVTTPNADGSPGSTNPNLSSAIQAGNRLYVAGITGNTAENRGNVRAQTTEVFTRIGRTLRAAGFDWANVVDGVVYLPDMTKFQDMNAAYREVLTRDFPARATVGTGLMGADVGVEIMFTAVK